MNVWLTETLKKSQDRNTSQDSSRPYGREFWDKDSNQFYFLRPEASDVHAWTYNWSLAYMLIYFFTRVFSRFLWQPYLPLPNLKSQLLLRSLDVHLVILLHQTGLHLLVSNFVLLQINKIVHQVWKLLDMFGHYRLQGTNPHESSIIFTGHSFRLKTTKLNICNFNRCTMIYVWIMVRSQSTDDDGRIFAPSQCSALSIERWPFWIGRSDTISSTLWMLDGSSPTRSALR